MKKPEIFGSNDKEALDLERELEGLKHRVPDYRVWDGESMGYMEEYSSWGHFWDTFDPGYAELVFLQYTGLKDKNGKKIYEGDILQVHSIGKVEVVFGCHPIGEDSYGIEHKTMGFVGEWEDGSGFTGLYEDAVRELEVIGNIYEDRKEQ